MSLWLTKNDADGSEERLRFPVPAQKLHGSLHTPKTDRLLICGFIDGDCP